MREIRPVSETQRFRVNGRGEMDSRLRYRVAVLIMVAVMAGCAARTAPAAISGYADRGIRLIAVMPVTIKTANADPELARIMRERTLEGLYFKGYPRIPVNAVDEALARIFDRTTGRNGDISPQTLRSLLSVDAVLYVTLSECRTATTFLYAATIISAGFELRDGKTGETLWKAQQRVVERSFDVTRKRLEGAIYGAMEPAIQAVVDNALRDLPDGPDAVK